MVVNSYMDRFAEEAEGWNTIQNAMQHTLDDLAKQDTTVKKSELWYIGGILVLWRDAVNKIHDIQAAIGSIKRQMESQRVQKRG